MAKQHSLVTVEDYEPIIGAEAVERIYKKAEKIKGLHVAHVNSTYYGGGVAELLSSVTLLMTGLGIRTGWRAIHGPPDFFTITKKMHNGLQGAEINLSEMKMDIYENVVHENSMRNHLDHDFVVIHDPQPLPMINHYRRHGPWVWRCHIDLTNPYMPLWDYLSQFVNKYDAAIVSLKEYARDIKPPQLFFMPAIDPFSTTNRELSDEEIDERLAHYNIPTDLPIVVQISRFDRWKDPEGVIKAFQIASKDVAATLILLGNVATDDPEGEEVYQAMRKHESDRVLILCHQDTALVNALQQRAAVVLQKSLREGFGLTVSEAMWKGTPVIGGDVGGIRYQIQDGVNGFLVSSVEQAAERIVQLVKDPEMCKRFGEKARETVRKNFLMTRLVEQYLDLFNAFETTYTFRGLG